MVTQNKKVEGLFDECEIRNRTPDEDPSEIGQHGL